MPSNAPDSGAPPAFWSRTQDELCHDLQSSVQGLTSVEALTRLKTSGPNRLGRRKRSNVLVLLGRQFSSPIVLILIAAAILSFSLSDPTDGAIILIIVLVSGFLGYWQEQGAASAMEKLLETVELRTVALRDGKEAEIPADELVPGDIVVLKAGSGIPADCILLNEKDLFIDEASLTGESYPVDKSPGAIAADSPLAKRSNTLFMGTHVVSGSGQALVVRTGLNTEFGKLSARLQNQAPETEFTIGIRRFGYLLMEVTLVLVIAIFAINVYLHKPVLDSFLFALALAVGLTPQLLPAVISVNLARGARRMAAKRVIVKRLAAIENFGSMNVLCSDKTGTLTQGKMQLQEALDCSGQVSDRVHFHAYVNASFETAFNNPIDEALRRDRVFSLEAWRKLDEIPYDFIRKRLSVLAEHEGRFVMITKGALNGILEVCTHAELPDGRIVPLSEVLDAIHARYQELSSRGCRTLGLALRTLDSAGPLQRDAEQQMTFLGMLAFADPPKEDIVATVKSLRQLGVSLKMITGDNALVAAFVAQQIGLDASRIITGKELNQLSDAALPLRVQEAEIFAEVEPNQKERIIRALRKAGHVVGYMGDGINDAPALHAADVSISVQEAVDVAKDAADIVLLDKDLKVLISGVREGRRTFANTMKYIFMATSANFGNMFSMAGASLFLPFLPLLPKQILLTNLLTDLPELTIAGDHVDAAMMERPQRWDISFIRKFMFIFGLISSVFDFLTFGVLLWLLQSGAAEFRTGWFVESVVSATLIILVVRTRGSCLRSRPSRALMGVTLAVVLGTLALPYTALGRLFGFVPLPARFLLIMGLIVLSYIVTVELVKRWFHRRYSH